MANEQLLMQLCDEGSVFRNSDAKPKTSILKLQNEHGNCGFLLGLAKEFSPPKVEICRTSSFLVTVLLHKMCEFAYRAGESAY